MAKRKTKSAKNSSNKARLGRPRGGPNRSDFIRSLPANMSANEVVAKGKANGLTISTGLVYVVRAKVASGAPQRAPGRPRKNSRVTSKTESPAKSFKLNEAERDFAEMILLIGLPRTEELISRMMTALGVRVRPG